MTYIVHVTVNLPDQTTEFTCVTSNLNDLLEDVRGMYSEAGREATSVVLTLAFEQVQP